jgi:hypothetical protein
MNADGLTADQERAVMEAVLEVKVAGAIRRLPILPRRAAREWRALWRARVAAEKSAADIMNSAGEAAELTGDVLLDLIVAYDRGGVLGGRDSLDDHASDREIRAIYDAICDESFSPLVQEGLAPMLGLALIEAIASRQASSIASRSSTGTLPHPPSTTRSPTARSRSSGPKTRRPRTRNSASA